MHHPVPPVVSYDEDRVILKFGAVEYRFTLDEATDLLTNVSDAWREAYDWEPPVEHDPFEVDDTRELGARPVENR